MEELKTTYRFIFKEFEPVFAHGFILCDPERLDQFCNGESQQTDLLARFDMADEWRSVCQQGIMVCVFNVEPNEYTLVVRHAESETYLKSALSTFASGWLLGTETGHLVISNLNNLMFWGLGEEYEYDNDYNKYEEFEVQPGWYQVEFQGGINSEGTEEEEWIFEFLLTPVQDPPDFAADLYNANNYFHRYDQGSESFPAIPDSSQHLQEIESADEDRTDKGLLLSLLSRFNTVAFESFVIELFNDRNEPFLRLQDAGDEVFRKPLLDSYGGSLDSVFLLHYLPLEILQDSTKVDITGDPLLAHRLIKVRDYYKGKLGHYGMVSEVLVKAAKLRSLAILTNLANIDKDYYQSDLIPEYHQLAHSLGLYVSSLSVGSYDSFIDLNASGTSEAFRRFLGKNSEGISIRLDETSGYVARFTYETSFEGVLDKSKYLCEPVFANFQREQEKILAEFEALIRSETREDVLEEFLVTHFREIFGSNYDRIETQVWLRFPDFDIAHKSRRLDVFLRNSVVNDWDLFEIKRVIPLTRTYRDVPVITSEIAYAVQQVKNYARILSQDSMKRRFAEQGIEYYEPSLNLVVGRTPQIPHDQWRWLVSSYDREVKILTFDNLLKQMKQRIEDRLQFLRLYSGKI